MGESEETGRGTRFLEALRSSLTRLNSLQARMALITGVLLVPAVVYSIWQAISAYNTHTTRLSDTIRSTADIVSTYETDFFQRTRGMLEQLSRDPAVRISEAGGCVQRLRGLVADSLEYEALTYVDASGTVVCSSRPGPPGMVVGDREWFQRLKRGTTSFSVSALLNSRATGERTIIAAAPILSATDGSFAGAVSAAIDLQMLTPGSRNISLPDQSIILLIDENDAPVVAPPNEAAAERAIPAVGNLRDVPGSFVAVGKDGVRRVYAVSSIPWGRLRVLIGIPTGGSLSWLREELIVGVFAPTLMLVVALVAIWWATNRLVNRHIHLLARAARSYSHGDLSARPKLDGAPTELAELGQVFAAMADRIAEHEVELTGSLAQKEKLIREIHHRVKNNLQIVTSLLNLRLRAVRNGEVRQALGEVQTRIKALALVHRSLYEQEDFGSVELQHFLSELAQLLIDGTDTTASALELEVRVAPTRVATEKAMAIALLITECVSDSLKHAFPPGREGMIRISLDHAGPEARLAIADDGVGRKFDGTAVLGAGDNLGITLSQLLAKQIGGELRVSGPPGTEVSVTFPLE